MLPSIPPCPASLWLGYSLLPRCRWSASASQPHPLSALTPVTPLTSISFNMPCRASSSHNLAPPLLHSTTPPLPPLPLSGQIKAKKRHLAIFFYPSIKWQGLGKHLVDNAPSVGILSCSKNPADARDKNIQQRAKSLSLARA